MRLRSSGRALRRLAISALAFASLVAGTARTAHAQDVQCDQGDREVHALNFVGNSTFSDDDLSSRVSVTPSSTTRRIFRIAGARRCLPPDGLAPDVARLQTFYRNNGFFDATIDTTVKTVAKNEVDVTFRINEGQPLTVDTLRIEGLDSVPDRQAILDGLQLRVGSRFGLLPLLTDVDTIENRLRNAGYPRADVFKAYTTHVAEHRAEVDLQVNTGARARFGTIAVSSVDVKGNKPPAIDSAVVLRLLGFRTGDLYTDRALADAQRNLYALGAYQHVGIALDTTFAHGDSVADVVVDLREGPMHAVDLEEGWATLDCFRVNSRYTDNNFQDKARHFEFVGQLSKLGYAQKARTAWTRDLCDRYVLDPDSLSSQKVNDHFGATISQPNVLGSHWTPAYTAYTERQGAYKAYLRTTDFGFSVTATRDIAQRTPLQLGYTFEHGLTQAEPAVLCGVFQRCTPDEQEEVERRLPFAVANAIVQRSTTDNLVAPTRGYVAAAELRYSAPWFASDPTERFLKGTGDISWYREVAPRITFAARARSGYIAGGASVNGTPQLPPPQERLYAGGATSVRGFQQNELGPQVYLLDNQAVTIDTLPGGSVAYLAKPGSRPFRSIPVGGNSSLVLNAELRLRDPFFPELIEYVPFVDAGQVWTRGTGQARFNVDQLDYTPGLSVRYFSPVGPIQLNAGYNRYGSRAGQAFFAAPVNPSTGKAPLICVTAPGQPLVPIPEVGGQLEPNTSLLCPNTYSPAQSGGFFRHLTLTLSINADF